MKHGIHEQQRGSVLKWFLLLLAGGVGILLLTVLTLYWSLKPDRTFREVESSVLNALSGGPQLGMALRAPSGLVSLARLGLSFVDDIDDEARLAIATLRGGQAGWYPLLGWAGRGDSARMMRRADEAMDRNDWERVAAVVDGDEMVLVYVPRGLGAGWELEAYAVVVTEEQLVIASVRGDPRPLFELIQDRALKRSTDR